MKSNKQFGKKYVCEVFRRHYILKWQGKGKNQQQFADAIIEKMPTAKCDNKNVSGWITGRSAPVKYLPVICELLEIDMEEFIPKTHDDRYRYSSEFADKLEKELELIAERDFQLDLTFLKGLRNIIDDFDSRFPQVYPLVFHEFDSEGKYFIRTVPAEAAKTSKGNGLLQIMKTADSSGKTETRFLTQWDLKLLKSVQRKMKKYVCAIFDETAVSLKNIEKEVNTRYIELNTDIWENVKLSAEELQKMDPYGFYTEAEKKKYRITEKRISVEQEAKNNGES